MADKVGVFNRLGAAVGASTATTEFEFLEGTSLGLSQNFVSTNGMRGSRSHVADRVREGTRRVDGNLLFAPTPAELDQLLYYAMGTAKSGNTIALAETVPAVSWIGVRDGTTYHYSGCVVDTMTLSVSEGGPLQLSLTVVGIDEAQEGSIGSLTIDASTGGPFVMSDGVATVGGTGYQFDSFELTLRNVLEVKYRNSLVPTQIKATDRMVEVNLPFSLGDASALYGSAVGGVAFVATFTNAAVPTVSAVFSCAAVQAPKQPLPFGKRGILELPWRGTARKTGSTKELIATIDSTV